jgi:hypothetical protein
VVDGSGSLNASVIEVTASGQQVLDANDPLLASPMAIACNASAVYIAVGSGTVYQIPISTGVASPFSTNNSFIPGGLAFSSDGTLYASASNQAAIYRIPSAGGAAINTGITGLASSGLHQLAITGTTLYVVASFSNQVFMSSTQGGAATGLVSSALNEPSGIALDPGGNVWISNLNTNDFVLSNASLTTSQTVTPTGVLVQGPGGLAWIGGHLLTQNVNQTGQPLVSLATTTVSAAPRLLRLSLASSTSVTARWTAPGWNGNSHVASYTVTTPHGAEHCTTKTTSCMVTGLFPGRTYQFVVTANNAAGSSLASAPVSIALPATPILPDTGSKFHSELILVVVLETIGLSLLLRRNRHAKRLR